MTKNVGQNETRRCSRVVIEYSKDFDSIKLINELIYGVKQTQSEHFCNYVNQNDIVFVDNRSLDYIKHIKTEYIDGMYDECSLIVSFNYPDIDDKGLLIRSIWNPKDKLYTSSHHMSVRIVNQLDGFKHKSSKMTKLMVIELKHSSESHYVLSTVCDKVGLCYYIAPDSYANIYSAVYPE